MGKISTSEVSLRHIIGDVSPGELNAPERDYIFSGGKVKYRAASKYPQFNNDSAVAGHAISCVAIACKDLTAT